jgi:hypothetical protein
MNIDRSAGDGSHPTGDDTAVAYEVARALTPDELDGVLDAIARAADPGGLLDSALRAIYDAGLRRGVHAGRPTAAAGPANPDDAVGDGDGGDAGDHRINPGDYAIPASQWQAITAAITNRAAEWGASATLAFELINLMPAAYEDPAAPVPAVPRSTTGPASTTSRSAATPPM